MTLNLKDPKVKLEYRRWRGMMNRCYYPTSSSYSNYGARGIKICDKWLRFENYFCDMGFPPSREHSLERIDNNGNYEPSNCRWATKAEQSKNRRKFTYPPRQTVYGDFESLKKWMDRKGISQAEFAKQIHISDSMLSLLFAGKRGVTQEVMLAIYRVTKGKITPNDLCGVRK